MFDEVQAVIEPYGEPSIECREFDPQTADIARQVSGLIYRYLPTLRVEHVGSTAVPGCGGRGIVDLLIACPAEEVEMTDALLARLGFRQGGEPLFPQHPPAYRGRLIQNGEPFLLHIHLLPADAEEVDSMRFLRSCLRADAELAKAYVQHKRAIVAGAASDEAEYCRQKAAFLKMVLG